MSNDGTNGEGGVGLAGAARVLCYLCSRRKGKGMGDEWSRRQWPRHEYILGGFDEMPQIKTGRASVFAPSVGA